MSETTASASAGFAEFARDAAQAVPPTPVSDGRRLQDRVSTVAESLSCWRCVLTR